MKEVSPDMQKAFIQSGIYSITQLLSMGVTAEHFIASGKYAPSELLKAGVLKQDASTDGYWEGIAYKKNNRIPHANEADPIYGWSVEKPLGYIDKTKNGKNNAGIDVPK